MNTTLVSTPATRAAALAALATTPTDPDELDEIHTPVGEVHFEIVGHLWDDLVPAPDNLRGTLTDIADLAESIAGSGLLSPLLVTMNEHGQPLIVAGHRRHAAIGRLIEEGRWPSGRRVACLHHLNQPVASDEDRTVAMLVENLQRVDLDPIEEASGYQRLVDRGWTRTRISRACGRDLGRVSGRLTLLYLPARLQGLVSDGELSLDLARQIAAAPEPVINELAASKGVPGEYDLRQSLRDHTVAGAKKLFAATVKARQLAQTKRGAWDLRQSCEKVWEGPVDDLSEALLPPAPTLYATLDVYGKTPMAIVWRPNGDTPLDEPAAVRPLAPSPSGRTGEDEAVVLWRATRDRIIDENRNRRLDWETKRDALIGEYARSSATKDVAAAAMWELVFYDLDQAIDKAVEHAGYTDPDLEHLEAARVFLEWVSVPKNLSATVAALILEDGWYEGKQAPFVTGFTAMVAERIGAGPEQTDLPPHPNIPVPREDDPDDDEDGTYDVDEDGEVGE
jgi:ParB-like chromosome segregation protein Spo0J